MFEKVKKKYYLLLLFEDYQFTNAFQITIFFTVRFG